MYKFRTFDEHPKNRFKTNETSAVLNSFRPPEKVRDFRDGDILLPWPMRINPGIENSESANMGAISQAAIKNAIHNRLRT